MEFKFKNNLHNKLTECITKQLLEMPFYGQYNLMVNFREMKSIPTCGVNVSRNGMNFYYNPDFLNRLPQEEVNFIDIHELYHLLFNHPKRTVSGRYNHYMANVVQDMIINSIIWESIDRKFVQIPKHEDGKNMALFIPKEYKDVEIFEVLYEWMMEKKKEYDKKKGKGMKGNGSLNKDDNSNSTNNTDNIDSNDNGGDGECDGEGNNDNGMGGECDGEGNNDNGMGEDSGYGKNGRSGNEEVDTYSLDHIFENIEKNEGQYLDIHIEDTIPEELRETIVNDAIEKLKSRGLLKGKKLLESINKLRKKRKDYLREIKRSVSNIIGSGKKQKTIQRLNRRGISGLKGNKKVKSKINVILDTSGSMNGLFEKVLSYIFQNDIEINLIQIDTEVREMKTISNMKDLQRISIEGLGGTILMPAVNYVVEKLNQYNTVILSDGYTDELNLSEINGKVLIISIGKECPTTGMSKGIKQIVVDPSYS